MKQTTKLYIGLGVLGVLTPIGLLASGEAWGEWGKEMVTRMIGYIPKGLDRFSDLWHAPMPDYAVPGTGGRLGYVLSAFGGMLLVIIVTKLLGKYLSQK